MTAILDEIVASKKQEVAERRLRLPVSKLEQRLAAAPPVRDFQKALTRGSGLGVIAEVKKASPSAGVLRADFDPVAIAQQYADAGADAISVLTDAPFFQGELAYVTAVRGAVAPPVLRKDFLIDPYQVLEARVAGADAVLLIAEILDDDALGLLLRETQRLGMQALVELHDRENVARVVNSGAALIGINNRDLRSFATRLEHTLELAPLIPRDRVLVSESGIRSRMDMERLRAASVRAVLIGETLMRARDVGAALRALRGESPS
jgi:indole-3-glycerol phosphate synthase